MAVQNIKPGIDYVGSLDWEATLFDALIPLPEGTSYNSYLIRGNEKTALIDTVDHHMRLDLIGNLSKLGIEKIDYIVANHAEQDHSGAIAAVLKKFHGAKIITNAKCKELLKEFFLLDDDVFIVVNDKDTLSLGDKTLQFIIAPWVHWPDTMFTYVKEDKVLFTSDFLGSHIANSELFANDISKVHNAAKRYYAQIMMPFRNSVKTNLQKIRELDVEIIGPSHGHIYNNPKEILDLYTRWSIDNVENEVIIPYVSMHGSTKAMVDYLTDTLIEKNIKVKPYNLASADMGELAMSLVDAATVVFASPAVLVGAHPKAIYTAFLANALRPKTKFVSVIGTFGWGCNILESLKGLIPNIKAEIVDPVIIKGYPKEDDFKKLDSLAKNILDKHTEIGVI